MLISLFATKLFRALFTFISLFLGHFFDDDKERLYLELECLEEERDWIPVGGGWKACVSPESELFQKRQK